MLLAERSGIQYTGNQFHLNYLARTEAVSAETALFGHSAGCLVIKDSSQSGVAEAAEQFSRILLDMKVSARTVDLGGAQPEAIPSLEDYRTVVVLMSNLDPLGTEMEALMDWVEDGGGLLLAMTPEKTGVFDVIAQKLGVLAASWEYERAESICPAERFMLGGGRRYEIPDPFESSLPLSLEERAEVMAVTGNEGVPLVWRVQNGAGRIVVDNIGIYGKVMRGFYAASYSLLEDACAYPVINGAAFYLDDFPSPVPSGNGAYIQRDYGMSIADFYSRVWWPDLVQLSERHGLRYTGVMIENYEDDTVAAPVRQTDMEQFRYFGGLLMRQGGELGYHGYNHQPLGLQGTAYDGLLGYNAWPDEDAMAAAMEELIAFQKEAIPGAQCSVYVPPSNVLSDSGRSMLGTRFPQIRTIASTYLGDADAMAYEQEFEVAGDGMVEQPRIISGGLIDDYMKLAALSELNMHFVSTHFMHPDDLLDEDRGAAEGWEAYSQGLEEYIAWLTASAPAIRMQTGTELSGAVQRFAGLYAKVETEEDAWVLTLDNFQDEAWLFFRANGAEPGKVSGGSLTELADGLYLLKAERDTVRIARGRERGTQ